MCIINVHLTGCLEYMHFVQPSDRDSFNKYLLRFVSISLSFNECTLNTLFTYPKRRHGQTVKWNITVRHFCILTTDKINLLLDTTTGIWHFISGGCTSGQQRPVSELLLVTEWRKVAIYELLCLFVSLPGLSWMRWFRCTKPKCWWRWFRRMKSGSGRSSSYKRQ